MTTVSGLSGAWLNVWIHQLGGGELWAIPDVEDHQEAQPKR